MSDPRADVRRALERARRLLALAADSQAVEEARTAALQAARLVKLHGLRVVDAVDLPTVLAEFVREHGPRAAEAILEEVLAQIRLQGSRGGQPPQEGAPRGRRRETIADVVADGAARVARSVVRDGIADVLGRGRRRRGR